MLISGIIAAEVLVIYLFVVFSTLRGAYMTALETKQPQRFYDGLRSVVRLICVKIFCLVCSVHAQCELSLECRSALLHNPTERYSACG